MAAHSNRSPSPLSSRPSNPNPRNSEIHSATRRSFNGNSHFAKPSPLTNPRRFDQTTPANSPSDFARRRSVGKESTGSCLKDCEEKENMEKDHFPKTSNSKNFMAPTISAASKFTPSPRKKALVERNDPVRTSISLSDGKAMFFSNVSEDLEPKSEMGYHQNQKNQSPLDLNAVNKSCSKKVTFLDVHQDSQNADESLPDSVISDSGSLKMESSSNNNNISCSPVSTPIAPLDADPSMPPYDPKTNYLSPRPQFLYYKPNPRIEVLLNKDKGMETDEFKPPEDDSFMKEITSDNFSSDSEGTQDTEKEAFASADMVVGFEDDLRCYEASEKESFEVMGLEFSEDDIHEDRVSMDPEKEKLEAIASEDMVVGLDETDDGLLYVQKNEKKPWGFSSKLILCFSVVMMVLLTTACVSISITRSPSFDEFGLIIKDLSFSDLGKNLYHQSRVATNAKVNFHRLVKRMNQFSVGCVDLVSKMANELGKGETPQLGVPLKYMNLSDLKTSTWHDGRDFLNNDNEISEDLSEHVEDDEESDEGLHTEMENFEEENEAYAEKDGSDEDFENEIDIQEDEVSEVEEKVTVDLDSDYSEGTHLLAAIPHDQESELEVGTEIVPSEISETEKSNGDIVISVSDTALLDQESQTDVGSSGGSVQDSIIPESPSPSRFESEFLAHYAVEISSFFAAVLAFAAFVSYYYKRNPSSSSLANNNNNKKMDYELSNNIKQIGGAKDESSSCPSEMSSFRDGVKKEMNEVQSVEGKTRKHRHTNRESLASSSSEFTMGSPSYGSFTTFEKIPIKNVNGEEEIITPVRRSSRIRSHQN